MKAELVPIDGGEPIPITKDVTVMGRREFCDVQIDHPSLSKRHCVLVKTDGLLVIRDLATTNGTKVKGQKIRWAALLPDDKIALGSIKFRVYLGPDDVPSPSEAAASGMGAAGKIRSGFPAPTPYPGVALPSRSAPARTQAVAPVSPAAPVPRTMAIPKPAFVPPPPSPSPSPAPASRPTPAPAKADEFEDLPLILEDDGAWRDALGPDSAEIPKIIEFD